MNYRFEPTGEVRMATEGDWYPHTLNCDELAVFYRVKPYCVPLEPRPIFRRVPHEENRPSDRLVERFREAANQIGSLFCWCVENLKNFPPREGDFLDDVKRRLKEAEDDAALVACGRLAVALHTPSDLPYTEAIACVAEAERLMRRAGGGERSPALVEAMIQLTERMKGPTHDPA